MSILCAFTAGVMFAAWLELKGDVLIYASIALVMASIHFWYEGD